MHLFRSGRGLYRSFQALVVRHGVVQRGLVQYYLKDGKMYTAKDEYTEPEVHSYFLDGDSLRIGETENTSIYFRRGF